MYSIPVYLFYFDSIVPSFGAFYERHKCPTYTFHLRVQNGNHLGPPSGFQPSNRNFIRPDQFIKSIGQGNKTKTAEN